LIFSRARVFLLWCDIVGKEKPCISRYAPKLTREALDSLNGLFLTNPKIFSEILRNFLEILMKDPSLCPTNPKSLINERGLTQNFYS
jgi:hypothetical protein